MRAEDLFGAMGELDEELIARSERSVREKDAQDMSTIVKKRRRRREIYRFAVVAMSTAVVVFVLLLARDFLGTRVSQSTKSSQTVTREYEAEMDSAEEETRMAEEAVEADAATESAGSGEAMESAEEAVPEEEEKTAVDLLGSHKEDYVSLEYISAEDEANGGETTVPEYTPEGEEILSRALENGKPTPEFLAKTGSAAYYVYLTRENGQVNKVTFYENAYVSMDSIPGVMMKISQTDYEDVLTLFR